ncbi:MAG: hotdog family protein, partial [Planctomycetota bacterium]
MPDDQPAPAKPPAEFPFILIDKVLATAPGERAIGLRNVTANDPLIVTEGADGASAAGGLRRGPVLEAFAQLASALPGPEGAPPRAVEISRIDSMRFLRTAVPGDQIVLTVVLSKEGATPEEGAVKASCKAEVEGVLLAEGTVEFTA